MKAPYILKKHNITILESSDIRDFIYQINEYFHIRNKIRRDDLVRLMYVYDIYVNEVREPALLKYLEILHDNNWMYEENDIIYIKEFI